MTNFDFPQLQSSGIAFIARRLLAPLILALTFSACAVLPDVAYLNTTITSQTKPTFVNAKGTPSKKKNPSLMSRRGSKSTLDMQTLAVLEEAVTGIPLIAGNKISLLFDGPQTMTAMIDAIVLAKKNINLETYIFDQDELGLRFADMLIAKQKEGVKVSIIYDAVGTIGTPQEFFDRMHEAGIGLIAFNPVSPLKRVGEWKINNRDHRKILIVDGKVAFTGGVNISGTYSKGSLFRSKPKADNKVGWRDTHIKIEGPAVAALQWIFLDTWLSQKEGDLPLPDTDYFPKLSEVGDKIVRVIPSQPGGDHQIYKSYVLAIQEAKKSIHITSAYFVPDVQILESLANAARKGVDVKIILPGVSDSGLVFNAGRSFYQQLLDSGVRIYELQVSVLHAKTAVIDGVWSTVGSTNLDMRSFLHNSEINVVVLGDGFGREMENAFSEDLRDSVEITKEVWGQRSLSDRLKEWSARLLEYWL